jgi:phosphate transport system substrate-binding protein
VPVNGKLVANPYKNWSDIDPKLPNEKIEVLGPPPTSGTRDAFVELVMEHGGEEFPEIDALDKKAKKVVLGSVREDGAFIEAGENDNLIVQKLEANPQALGIFGFSYLDQNADKIKGAVVEGKQPTFDNISSGAYPVSRSLFFYVKKEHVGTVPGIQEFVKEFTSEAAAGGEGYLADKGLIPLPKDELKKSRDAGANLTPINM